MSRKIASTLVAREFLNLANCQGRKVTPLKLLKLVFLAHGWAFVHLERPLICEQVEAWPYGPVFPELYHVLKVYGGDPVETVAKSAREMFMSGRATSLEKLEEKLVKSVYEAYKDLSAGQLVALTHAAGSPWGETIEGDVIDESKIRDYYMEMAKSG